MVQKYDLVLYGATGFTGRLAAQHIALAGENLRVAIAGRNRQKLEELNAELSQRFAIIVADSSDVSLVEAMVQSTRVVVSFAGPFALYGENVIAACAKFGRDYLDITGETPFIRSMIDRYQAQALASGARLIPFSGFDSVPADVCAYLALETAKSEGIKLDDLQLNYQIKGGFNGGTLETALNIAESASTQKLLDGNILIPDRMWPKAQRIDFAARYQPYLQRWTSPFLMGAINRAVVRRSAYLRAQEGESSPDFHYEERMLAGKKLSAVQAYAGTGVMAGLGLLTQSRLGRKFLRTVGPKPGEGPSGDAIREGFFRGTLIAKSFDRPRVVVKMERQGDPGNEVTIALALTSARLAAENKFRPGVKGFLTPTVAFGDALKDALQTAGFRLNVEILR